MPNGLSQVEFFDGFSVPRNKELMHIYKDLDLVEQLGSGVPRILESYGKECFKFSTNFLRMTFPKEENGRGAIGGAIDGAIGGAINQLTDRQKEILQLIIDNPKIGYREVAKKLSINPSASQSHFDTLKEKGIIERSGGTRGVWVLKFKDIY